MYTILLLLSLAAVIACPLALDLWLTARETRAARRAALARRRQIAFRNAKGPQLVCAAPRL